MPPAASARSNIAAQTPWTAVKGPAPGLIGVPARLRLQVGGAVVGVLQVEDDGEASIAPDGPAEGATLLVLDSEDTLMQLLRGEASPIVAGLRGRLRVKGDMMLALKVLFGLEAGSPWAQPAAGAATHAV